MANLLWSYARLPLYATTGIVGFLSSALYYYQNELIYPRNLPPGARTETILPSAFNLTDWTETSIPTPDGETLHAYLIPPQNASHDRKTTIIMFHGNAGTISHRIPIARVFASSFGCHVLMLEYRGYGKSTGDPGEKGMRIDAQAGLDWVLARDELKGNRIVVYGQSIGGAVGVALAAAEGNEARIDGLVLENTFLSIARLIPSVMPAARWLTPLCHEKWPSETEIVRIKRTPVLFLSGLRDEIVPPSHMKELFRICTSKTKVWRELPHGDHNNSVAESAYFHHIEDFFKLHIDIIDIEDR